MSKESTKSPLHLKAPWHSLAGHLLEHTTTVIGYFCSQCNMGNMANQILTPSLHWCSQGRAQQRVGQRHPCSWQRACTAQRLAPMTTNCTHHSCHKTCDTLQHLESLWSQWNIPLRVSIGYSCTESDGLNYHGTNLTLAVDIALVGLRDVHHLLILSFSLL